MCIIIPTVCPGTIIFEPLTFVLELVFGEFFGEVIEKQMSESESVLVCKTESWKSLIMFMYAIRGLDL